MPSNTATQRGLSIAAGDAALDGYFGASTALNAAGTVLVAGAARGSLAVGGVYTYDLVSNAWVQRGAVLLSPNGAGGAFFGRGVALSANGLILAVGSPGNNSVFLFDLVENAWVARPVLQAATVVAENFGFSVALSANGLILAVGVSNAAAAGASRGLVAIYDWNGTAWVLRGARLGPVDPTDNDAFGQGVALSATGAVLAIVSKRWVAGSLNHGAVYIYDWNGTAWVVRGSVVKPNTEDNTFTHSVAISADGEKLFIGVGYNDTINANAGAVFIYKRSGTAWLGYAPLVTAANGAVNDYLGTSVAVSETGASLVAGAERRNGAFVDQGEVYTYDIIYGPQLVGTLSGTASLAGSFTNIMLNDLLSVASTSEVLYLFFDAGRSDTSNATDITRPEMDIISAEFAGASDAIEAEAFAFYVESLDAFDSLSDSSNTTLSYDDSAEMLDIAQLLINQLVADSAAGIDGFSIDAAMALVDIADAVTAETIDSVVLVAELIAIIEALHSASINDIIESGVLTDAYAARVEALVALLEAAQAVDVNTAMVHVMQAATDSANGVDENTPAGSLLNALLADAVLATIRINIGGEMFTGWVLNTDTLAPSEYQFADLQFNSACKHGDTYLLAADDGIYQFTEDAGVEAVMTYIKTGKTDFGSDLRKSVTNAYMVYSASGQMVLKVTTSANGALQTNDYAMVPFAADDTPDPQRVTVGKGLKSRYWQFELTGDNAGCTFDEIGMLPVVLSRRI